MKPRHSLGAHSDWYCESRNGRSVRASRGTYRFLAPRWETATYDGHEAGHATDAETGKDTADRKERDVGRRRLHRDAGAEQDQVRPDADATTELVADEAGADGADEGTGGEDRGLRRACVSAARAPSSTGRRTMSESVEVLITYSPLA